MHLGKAIAQLHESEIDLARSFREVGERHPADHDVYHLCHQLAKQCLDHASKLEAVAARYDEPLDHSEPSEMWQNVVATMRRAMAKPIGDRPIGSLVLLRDLRALYLGAQECNVNWTIVSQGAKAVRDKELIDLAYLCNAETGTQIKWLLTRLKVAAPQPLAVG